MSTPVIISQPKCHCVTLCLVRGCPHQGTLHFHTWDPRGADAKCEYHPDALNVFGIKGKE